ncbi:hypothetical protein ECB41_A0023 [Escherichia coli B41]|nr:hypothetical protein ECB41_A0023 [Escherichia coli B41]
MFFVAFFVVNLIFFSIKLWFFLAVYFFFLYVQCVIYTLPFIFVFFMPYNSISRDDWDHKNVT